MDKLCNMPFTNQSCCIRNKMLCFWFLCLFFGGGVVFLFFLLLSQNFHPISLGSTQPYFPLHFHQNTVRWCVWKPVLCLPCRYDGSEEDDGEAWCSQDPLGDEEDDLRGDWWQQRHHQLQRLCQDDAGEALSCAEIVSLCAASTVFCADSFCLAGLFIGSVHV